MDKLKPCPFCGAKAKIGNNFEGQFFVWCTNDDCDARIFSRVKDNAIRAWNRRAEETSPQPDGEVECVMCSETFTEDDLEELRGMGEQYHREDGCFLCPDCWDSFRRMDPEEQVKMAIMNGWKEV